MSALAAIAAAEDALALEAPALAEPDARLAEILIDDWINGTALRLTFEPHRDCPCADCAAAFEDMDGPA